MLAVFGLASYKLLPFQNIYFNLSTIKSFQESFYKIRDDLKETINISVNNNQYKELILRKSLELKNINWNYKKSKKY